jgi:hypothetical protein
MPGTEFLVDGLGMTEEVIIAVRIDCAVACRLCNKLGAGFVELDS